MKRANHDRRQQRDETRPLTSPGPRRARYKRRATNRRLLLEHLEPRVVLSVPTIYTVNLTGNSTSGSGMSGTLPFVISQANVNPNPAGSEIEFASVFSSQTTITLAATLALSETAGPEVIEGPGAGLLTVNGNGAVRVFQIDNAVMATISGMTISGGSTTGNGGGVANYGTATLTDCMISGNQAYQEGGFSYGGGVWNDGTATLTGCTISGNLAVAGGGVENSAAAVLTITGGTISENGAIGGGGVLNQGNATVDGCDFTSNAANTTGGGFSNLAGTASLSHCGFSNNSAYNFGGGISVYSGSLTIAFSTVTGNSADSGGGLCVASKGAATLTSCTISSNSANLGGGLFVAAKGTVSLTSCTISSNSVTGDVGGDGGGAGILNKGTATLSDCTISHNSAKAYGGGMFNQGNATLDGSDFTSNVAGSTGGGFSNYLGNASLSHCSFSDNSAGAHGGGIAVYGGSLTITLSSLTGNSSGNEGGGVANYGTITLSGCTISDNFAALGGGVGNASGATLIGCTISDNRAGEGGGIANDSSATLGLTDCTIDGNYGILGGGLAVEGSTTLTACTISGNSAGEFGGAGVYSAGTATLTDTIIGGNTGLFGPSDISGSGASQVTGSYNLIGTGGSGGITNGVNGNIVLTSLANLDLGPLANNGGPTETMALLPGTAAIGAGTAVAGVTTDQRGDPLDSPPDIGAYQVQPRALVGDSIAVTSSASTTDFGQSVTLTATVLALPPGAGTPTGTVTFYDGTTALDTATLSGGTASYTTTALAVGVHSITVQYSGDTNFVGGTSNTITQTVNPTTMIWTNPAGGDWDTASNWVNAANPSDHEVPTAADNAEINISGITVTHSSNTSDAVNSLTVASGSTLSLSSGTLSITAASTISGTLTMNGGTLAGSGTLTNAGTLDLIYSTINAPVVNQGTIVVQQDSSTISGSFTNAAGATLDLQGGYYAAAVLNVTSGLSNSGTIDLTNTYNGGDTLTVTGGTLVNASGGAISMDDASGDTINAQIDNQAGATLQINQGTTLNSSGTSTNEGTISLDAGLTINQSGTNPSFTNTGSITIGEGQTLVFSGGTFTQSVGLIDGAGTLALSSATGDFSTPLAVGTLSLNSSSANLSSALSTADTALSLYDSTLNDAATVTNATGVTSTLIYSTINAPVVNQGTIVVQQDSSTISGSFTNAAGGALDLQGEYGAGVVLNATSGLNNSGTIDLTGTSIYASGILTVTGGTLVNASGGTISTDDTIGDTINAQIDNQAGATLQINQGTTLNSSGTSTNEGTISLDAGLTINQSGTNPSFTNTGSITIGEGQTLVFSGGTFTQSVGLIDGAGTLALSSATGDFSTPLAVGTLSLNSSSANLSSALSTADTALSLYDSTLNDAATVTNATGVTSTLIYSTINAPVVNQGTIVVQQDSSTISGSFTNAAGGALDLQGEYGAGVVLNATSGLNNSGTIDLTGTSIYASGILTVTGGTLVNASGGTISTDDTIGDTINAQIDNQAGATLQINQGTTLNSSGTSTNEGTISLDAGLTINQSGTNPSFTNTGSITIGEGQTLVFSGGTFTQSVGLIDGAGTLALSSATGDFSTPLAVGTLSLNSSSANLSSALSTADTALSLYDSTLNDAATVTNATGVTSTLIYSTINAPVVNQGTIVVQQDSSTISGSFTNAAGGALDLQGEYGAGVVLNATSGLNNSGTIDLTGTSIYASGILTVTGGTLVNASGGTISTDDTIGDTINAQIDNQAGATLQINQGTTLNSSGTSTNEGTISLDAGLTINQSGTNPSFTNTGSMTIGSGLVLQFNGGGTFAGTIEATGGGSLVMTTAPTNLVSGTLTGATWIVGSNSSMSLGANITTDAASIILDGAGASFSSLSNLAKVASGGSLQLLNGASLATSANLDNAGTITLNPGTWNVTGNFSQESTGALDIGVGGLAAGSQFGQLNVSGQTTLDGALNVSLLNGYTPPSGDSYGVLNFGSRTGDFTVETGLYLGAGEGFDPTYSATGLDLVVIPEEAGTTTTVSSSLSDSTYGQAVTFTATVASSVSTDLTPTGSVTFFDGGYVLGTATLNGSATANFTTTVLIAGSHSIVAQFNGDTNFSGSNSSAISQSVSQDGSETRVTASLNPSTYGEAVTFTATVTAAAPGSGTPTGTITFYNGSTSLGSVPLNDGSATLTTSTLGAGAPSITASYNGDSNFTGSTSPALSQTVDQDGSTTTLSSLSANPSVFGQSVTFTATVTAAAPGSGTPTGTVTFYAGSNALGTVGLSGGVASFTTSTLAVGSDSISATYNGDVNFITSGSASLLQTVNQDASVSVVVGAPAPSILGQTVTFTATVTAAAPGSGTPTGNVTFFDGSTAVDTETLSDGSASFATSTLSLGSHQITIAYNGDADFTGSTSPVFDQVVNKYDSTTSVGSSVDPSVYGQSVTFTATVSATDPGDGTPTGTVTFFDGSTALDTETLSDGSATFATSALSVSGHSITAVYGGDASFNGSASTALSQAVDQDGSATVVISSADPSVLAQSVTFTATVTASAPGSGTPTGTVTFYDGTMAIDTAALSDGTASFTTSSLALGDHAISASYTGDTNFAGSTATAITQTVNLPPPATLDGTVFNDLSGSGSLAAGDPGLAGWTVQLLDSSDAVVATTTTDSNGDYSFTGVEPGSYTIDVIGQTGFIPTVPGSQSLAVAPSAGQTIDELNFGEFQTVTIGGEVYNDANDDGALDNGETGAAGWTVNLRNAANQIAQTVTTDTSGDYSFSNVGPGHYTIAEVLPAGYVQTQPTSGSIAFTTASATNLGGEDIGIVLGPVLSVTNLATTPSTGLQSGTSLTISWNDTNSGGIPVTASFTDYVTITNTMTNQVLGTPGVTYNVNTRGALDAGGSAAQQYTFTLPNGSAGVGNIEFTVTADEYDSVSNGLNASGRTTSINENSALAAYADLIVTPSSLTVTPISPQSGGSATATWTDTNQGDGAVNAAFSDYVLVQRVVGSTLTYVASGFVNGQTLAAGATGTTEQFQFTMPDGASGAGGFQVTVTTDYFSTVKEYDSSGNAAYSNNATTVPFISTVSDYADLVVASGSLVVSPTSPQSGGQVTISWADKNQGDGAVAQAFSDYVLVQQVVGSSDINIASGYVAGNATLAAGANSATQNFTFTLPPGTQGSGNMLVTVTTDVGQTVKEYDSGGNAAYSNDTSTTNFTASLAPYPDLSASGVSAAGTLNPGQQTTVTWSLSNGGTASATGPWTEQVLLATDAAGDNPTLLATQNFTGTLAATQTVARSLNVQIPQSFAPGTYWFEVRENPFGQVYEVNTANNTAVATSSTNIAAGLTLSLATGSVADNAGANATTATVTRNTSTTAPLIVTLGNSDPNDVSIPSTVTIPAGASSASFTVGVINNHVVEGTQTATLTASAVGEVTGSAMLSVTDTNVPTLSVNFSAGSVEDNATNPAGTGTVTSNDPAAGPLTVTLTSNDGLKLTVPQTVIIPAGMTSATFSLTVVNDMQIDGDANVTVTATAAGFVNGSGVLDVLDANIPTMMLTLTSPMVEQNAGTGATTGTITLNAPANRLIEIDLSIDNSQVATVPSQVVINSGQTSVSFPVNAVNDGLDIGNQYADITAKFVSASGAVLSNNSVSTELTELDTNGPSLAISLPVAAISATGTTIATLSRNTSTTQPLTVLLSSTNTNHATVPAEVLIPAGQASTTFTITGVDDHLADGEQYSLITASAGSFSSGVATIGVTTVDLPDLVVSNVTAPIAGQANGAAQISWTVLNNGLYPAEGSWIDEVFLDPLNGAQGGGLVDAVAFNGSVVPGQSYTQNDTIALPPGIGQYSVRIVADENQAVEELSFTNNTGTSAQPVTVSAPYSATLATTVTAPVSNGTSIPMQGQATDATSGQPEANVPVAVWVLVSGTAREYAVETDKNGNYSFTFNPLPNEAGLYTAVAAYPGVSQTQIQAEAQNPGSQSGSVVNFTILGMAATPANALLKVVPETPLSGTFTLNNLSNIPLSNLTATAVGAPSDLTVQLSVPSSLAGSGNVTLSYTITATGGTAESDPVVLKVTSAEGAVLTIPIDVSVVPLTPILAANPGYLDVGMLVGGQTSVSFTITNNGGAPSGPIQVELPTAPYLSLESSTTIGSLTPGQSSTVTVLLTPDANLALAQYTGNLALSYAGKSLSVPFDFTATTSATGSVQVLVDDDFTFTEAGEPHVAAATVELLDPYQTSTVVATATTDATGEVTLNNITAGPYVLQVSAAGHQTYQASINVVPGITTPDEVFLNNSLVTYTWQVVPTEIQDQYTVQLQTTFVTNVPAPVVTLTGRQSVPTLQPGQSAQINFTATNYGLIAAQGFQVTLPTDSQYTFSSLGQQGQVVDVGDIPANSSVTIPVMVTFEAQGNSSSSPSAADIQPQDLSSVLPCTLDIPGIYFFTCDGTQHELTAATTLHLPGRVCDPVTIISNFDEIIDDFGIGGEGGGDNEGGGNQGGGNQGGPSVTVIEPPAVETPVNCNACLANLGAGLAVAAANIFTPLGDINLIISTNNLINSLLFGGEPLGPEEATHTIADLENLFFKNEVLENFSNIATLIENIWDPIVHSCLGLGSDGEGAGSAPGSDLGGAEEATESIAQEISLLQAASGDNAALDADLASIEADLQAMETLTGPLQELTGSYDWVQTTQPTIEAEWFAAFSADMADTPDGSIDAADEAQLLATTLPSGVTIIDATNFIERWNQSVQYYAQGITTASQVPAGGSTNFIDINVLQSLLQSANNAIVMSQAAGYSDPVAQSYADINQFVTDNNNAAVCASITLQIDQTVTLTRSAFQGTLDISNDESGPLTGVQVQLQVTDANGNPVSNALFSEAPVLSGLTAVDGTGVLAAGTDGSVEYTFIPTDTAADDGPTIYNIGGTLSYIAPDTGEEVSVPIYPATITVYPQANLELNYFLQTDVFGDDPSTPQIEPSEPATLGLLITNVGAGAADNLSITTAQPQIIQNEKGLLNTFQIIGTQVGNQTETPSLTANFGNLAPGQTGDASFLLVSQLQGVFTSFSATFTHTDALGGTETSLISSVTTHTLVHAGDFNYADSDGSIDYLADDTPNPNDLPDTIYFSDGTTAPVNVATGAASTSVGAAGALTYEVTANVTSGWDYIQLPDPGAGYTLYEVVRSDGTVIPVSDQAWQTDRTFDPTGKSEVDYVLHILDDNSTGSYMVYYKPTTTTTPAVTSVSSVASPQTGPISSINVAFNEAIDPTTFTDANLSLSLNGGTNLINSGVTIAQDTPTTFTINGLSALTGDNGNYTLTVSAMGVNDFFGDVGTGSMSTSWSTGVNAPVVVSVGADDPSLRDTPVSTVDVVLSEPIQPASFTDANLSLTLNGGPDLINSGVSVAEVGPTTYRISGLSGLTAADGQYDLTVNASGLVDLSNNQGTGALSETWTMNTVGPTITSLPTIIQSPRNIIVPTIDVQFSEAIEPASFTYQALTYSKQGGPNLISSGVTITQLTPTEFAVSNFNNLIAPIDGVYTFIVNAADITDLAGNAGSGTASATWDLQTIPPLAPSNLAVSPNTGITPGLTDTGTLTFTGTLSEPGLTVDVMAGNTDLGYATVTGTTFSMPVTLPAGTTVLTATATDAAANVSPGGTFSVFVDETPPAINSIAAVGVNTSHATNTAIGTVNITFSKAINPATFSTANLSLTLNGGPNLINGAVTLTPMMGNTYQIGGLGALTTAEGTYTLTVNAAGIQDNAGNALPAPMSTTWVMDQSAPSSSVETLPATTTSVSITVTATSSDPTAADGGLPSGVATIALYFSDDNGPFAYFATVTPASPSTTFTGQTGHSYGFYSVATDNAGNVQATPAGPQQTVEIVSAVTLASITVSPADLSVTNGLMEQFTAIGTYSDGSTQDLTNQVTWASATTAVATITASGLATGVGTGTSTISATDGAIVGSTLLTIVPPMTKIAAQPPAGVLAYNTFGLTVDELNAQNQIDTSYNGSVTVSFANNPGGSTLGGQLTVQAVNGVATFSGLTISNPGLAYTLQVSATGASAITTAPFDVAGYELVANGPNENLVWFGTTGSDEVQFTQTDTDTVQITVTELAGLATAYTATVTGVTGNVVVHEYDVTGDTDVIDGGGLTTISSMIIVGDGNDTIIGGGGANTIVAGDGDNLIYGNGVGNSPNAFGVQDPNNTITVGNGNNIIYGNYSWSGPQGGNNTITAGDGNNTIYGNYGYGDYDIDGAEGGNNTITVGNGNNTIYGNYDNADGGEGGNNTIIAGDGNDVIFGNGAGDDPDRAGGNNFIQVGNGNDTIYGNFGGDGGEGGNNTILTGSGQDTIYGNFGGDGGIGGNNLIVAGGGNDTIYAHSALPASGTTVGTTTQGQDVIIGGSGADTVYGWPAGYTLGTNTGDLFIAGATNLTLGALDAVLAEWVSSDDYATRVADLSGANGPVGINGGNYLISGTTVIGSDAVDQIFGTVDSTDDWFLVTSNDVLNNVDPDEVTQLD